MPDFRQNFVKICSKMSGGSGGYKASSLISIGLGVSPAGSYPIAISKRLVSLWLTDMILVQCITLGFALCSNIVLYTNDFRPSNFCHQKIASIVLVLHEAFLIAIPTRSFQHPKHENPRNSPMEPPTEATMLPRS